MPCSSYINNPYNYVKDAYFVFLQLALMYYGYELLNNMTSDYFRINISSTCRTEELNTILADGARELLLFSLSPMNIQWKRFCNFQLKLLVAWLLLGDWFFIRPYLSLYLNLIHEIVINKLTFYSKVLTDNDKTII